jgi:hypothetical protein
MCFHFTAKTYLLYYHMDLRYTIIRYILYPIKLEVLKSYTILLYYLRSFLLVAG